MDHDAVQHFVARSRERLNLILQRLQWTEAGVLQQHHGYNTNSEELSFPPSCLNSNYSIQINEDTVQRILQTKAPNPVVLPQTFDMLQSSYTAEQKLLIYQYTLNQTPYQQPVFADYADFAKMVAVTKRGQISQRRHRKTKPTVNEELHQLIELQMQALRQQQLHEQSPEKPRSDAKTNRDQKEHRKKRKRSRSPDRSRHRTHSNKRKRHCSRHKHKRSRSRSRSRNHSSRHRSGHKKHR